MESRLRDDWHTHVGSGYIFPSVLATMILVHLLMGRIWWPLLRSYQWSLVPFRWREIVAGEWLFWCILAAEAGIGLYCFAHYGLANSDRFARLTPLIGPLKLLGYIGMTIGVLSILANFIQSAIG